VYASHPAGLRAGGAGPEFPSARTGRDGGLSIEETPLVPLKSLARDRGSFELWAKLESRNPSGSVKDRAASWIVRTALEAGTLGAGRTLIDASSGNTAVAYARLGSRLGFPVELYVPRNANPERLARIRAYGARLVLTDPAEGTDGALREARARAVSDPDRYFLADQYHNPANPGAHYATTGPEIWRQTRGRVTHFVAGVGTGGTISGVGRFLKEQRPAIEVIAVEPSGPMHGLEGLKHLPTANIPSTYDPSVIDRTVRIETEEALSLVTELARSERLHVGPSSGAAVAAALRIGASAPNAYIVTLLPDGGDGTSEGTA
jgi:S-sulfo-L-cysteine synthase (O-acetyl-L-serine-dependent)